MRVAVVAEQNFNMIDGSTIWLLNTCKLLALQDDLDITLVLSHALVNRILADEVPDTIRVIDPVEIADLTKRPADDLNANTIVGALGDVETELGAFDRIFVRGAQYLTRLLSQPTTRKRVVGYAPSVIPDITAPEPEWITYGREARTPFVVQSDAAKTAMESLHDYPANIVHTVPPIVFPVELPPKAARDGAVLCYSGKIDLHYGMDWLIDVCDMLDPDADLGVQVVAGKDTFRKNYPKFFTRMDDFRARYENGDLPNVSMVNNVPHSEAKAIMSDADFAYCLRHARYDDVIEISTKIVEFATASVPPILNDNALNRSLFGEDYPYYVDIVTEDVPTRIVEIMQSKGTDVYDRAQASLERVAAQFSSTRLSEKLAQAIRGYASDAPALTTRPRRILLASHDLKFAGHFLDRVRADKNIEIVNEHWVSTIKPERRPFVADDIDTVFCEWCCENAVWHSNNKRDGTKLIVRLHRFEAFRDFPKRVDWSNVDALIVVSDHFKEIMVETHGVAPERVHVMPQYIDWHGLQRPKTEAARFTLGFVGINPFEHKRFDRAIDFVAALRAKDDRFTLAVRSVMPWQIEWVWNNRQDARDQFNLVFDRIFTDPLLKGAVRFDLAGRDMEEWYRDIGVMLSSSDSEGCHTSIIEGMASGTYAVVHDWPGARSLFSPYVHSDMTEAVDDVIAFADDPDLPQLRRALSDSTLKYDVEQFVTAFFKM